LRSFAGMRERRDGTPRARRRRPGLHQRRRLGGYSVRRHPMRHHAAGPGVRSQRRHRAGGLAAADHRGSCRRLGRHLRRWHRPVSVLGLGE
jgi:hypothetical protein